MKNKIEVIRKNNDKVFCPDDLLLKLVKENLEINCVDNTEDNIFIGYTKDILNIHENSSDKKSVELMFFQFTGIDFEIFLDKCILEIEKAKDKEYLDSYCK